MISIICASNNKDVLEKMLISSLKEQTYKDFELIIVNAKEKKFKSASETLNYGASIAKGDLLLFVHQDIRFLKKDALQKIYEYSSNNEFSIAGVCGIVSTGDYKIYSSVEMGLDNRQAGIKNNDVMKIHTLDECLLVIKTKQFKGFDNLGKTWHFYAVEYCIRANKQQEDVLLFPIEIYHLSPGWSLDYSYFDTLKIVAKKYKEQEKIKTCMGVFNNNWTLSGYCLYRKVKILIKKILHIKNDGVKK